MRRLGALLAACALMALALPSYAPAGPSEDWFEAAPHVGLDVTNTPAVQRSITLAYDFWKQRGETACENFKVYVSDAPTTGSMWGATGLCWTVVVPSYWAAFRSNLYWLCSAITHEMGHSLGHAHSDDPLSVMYSGQLDGSAQPGCVRMATSSWSYHTPRPPHGKLRKHARVHLIQRQHADTQLDFDSSK